MIKTSVLICLVLAFACGTGFAQKTKPWTEWSEKDAEKILNDSAWGQTQSEETGSQATQTSAISSTTAARERTVRDAGAAANSAQSGESRGPTAVHYRVRLLTAKPIRAAFVRLIELQGASPERMAELRPFVDRDFGDYIVVTISLDGNDRKHMMPVQQALTSGEAATLKETTFLERKDGTRVPLSQYRPPSQDGLGAKFVFPRTLDGKPFIDAGSGEVRFGTELVKGMKIIRRFKISEMMYDGKLEY
jgi:hypothetical protein